MDETYFGGEYKNLRCHRTQASGRGTKQITAQPIPRPSKQYLQGFVLDKTTSDAMVYTDDWGAYFDLPVRIRW